MLGTWLQPPIRRPSGREGAAKGAGEAGLADLARIAGTHWLAPTCWHPLAGTYWQAKRRRCYDMRMTIPPRRLRHHPTHPSITAPSARADTDA